MAIVNTQIDSGETGGRVLLDPLAWNIRFAAHEMGHTYGLDHSWSSDANAHNGGQPGEYDDQWDEMSAANVHSFGDARFTPGGVGFGGFQKDKLGWISRDRVQTFGADGASSRTYDLAPLNDNSIRGGIQYVRIPFDPADRSHYYSIEYRRRAGWDRGIPGDTVVIHEVATRYKGNPPAPYVTSVLLRDTTGARSPWQSLNANGVTIRINRAGGSNASVTVTSQISDRCKQGYVWREANASDHVCVSPAVRSQTRDDNVHAVERRQGYGPYGTDTCKQGYVWREANMSDHVCVTPQRRVDTSADNARGADRKNPARDVYGPNTCKEGYVWRDADLSDYVCVTPAVRSQTRDDNVHAVERRQGYGPYGTDTCKQGYVWRDAWNGDHVCVPPQRRAEVRNENLHARDRVEMP